ncbi:hypothetical protein G7K_2918-t1 [Saitoella complicata NRRL Y-17804]|uniref:Uncharacterized protein n=1 Tax=Saitoella complicata (strain BCRC 22490 / CBS 7301 / JCM 7358 / NBRC 10748 / NRRL Y-17804) TaxID=698492 RepID=A0A0E9NFY2_SAICN|nr:hypothetical protein G7K_2918-t1 [Saitoella complicata NRRL Y-17804]
MMKPYEEGARLEVELEVGREWLYKFVVGSDWVLDETKEAVGDPATGIQNHRLFLPVPEQKHTTMPASPAQAVDKALDAGLDPVPSHHETDHSPLPLNGQSPSRPSSQRQDSHPTNLFGILGGSAEEVLNEQVTSPRLVPEAADPDTYVDLAPSHEEQIINALAKESARSDSTSTGEEASTRATSVLEPLEQEKRGAAGRESHSESVRRESLSADLDVISRMKEEMAAAASAQAQGGDAIEDAAEEEEEVEPEQVAEIEREIEDNGIEEPSVADLEQRLHDDSKAPEEAALEKVAEGQPEAGVSYADAVQKDPEAEKAEMAAEAQPEPGFSYADAAAKDPVEEKKALEAGAQPEPGFSYADAAKVDPVAEATEAVEAAQPEPGFSYADAAKEEPSIEGERTPTVEEAFGKDPLVRDTPVTEQDLPSLLISKVAAPQPSWGEPDAPGPKEHAEAAVEKRVADADHEGEVEEEVVAEERVEGKMSDLIGKVEEKGEEVANVVGLHDAGEETKELKAAAEEKVGQAQEKAKDVTETVQDKAAEVVEQVPSVDEAKEKAAEVAETVKDKAAEVAEQIPSAEDVKEKAQDVAETVQDKAVDVKDAVVDTIPSTEEVRETALATKENVKALASEAQDKVQEQVNNVVEAVPSTEQVVEAVKAVPEQAQQVASDAVEKVQNAVPESVTQTAQAVSGNVQETAQAAVDVTKDVAAQAQEQARGLSEQVLAAAHYAAHAAAHPVEAIKHLPENVVHGAEAVLHQVEGRLPESVAQTAHQTLTNLEHMVQGTYPATPTEERPTSAGSAGSVYTGAEEEIGFEAQYAGQRALTEQHHTSDVQKYENQASVIARMFKFITYGWVGSLVRLFRGRK